MLTQEQHTALYFYLMSSFFSQASDLSISTLGKTATKRIASMSPEDRQNLANESLDGLKELYTVYTFTIGQE